MADRATGFIEFEIVGGRDDVQSMLELVDSSLSPTGLATFLYGSVGPWVKQRAKSRFENEGDDVTGKWAPLKETTVEIREGLGLSGRGPINKRRGELEEYILQGSVGVTAAPGLGTLTYPDEPPQTKSLREKLSTAQRGKANPSTIARPVLGLNEQDLLQIITMLGLHVQNQGRIRAVRR